MAYSNNLHLVALPVAADSSTYQYRFLSLNASGQMALTGAGAQADGVLQDKPSAQGNAGAFAIGGLTKVVCGGTVTAGGLVASNASGQAVDATTGDNICAVALEAGVSGRIISVLLKLQNANAIA